jgi:hypothetical protein
MKRIDIASVVQLADRTHDLQRRRRELIAELRAVQAELDPLRQKLTKVNDGHDFCFASSDGFVKVVEVNADEGRPDIEAMKTTLLKLKRKIPMTGTIAVVVRYQTEDEVE